MEKKTLKLSPPKGKLALLHVEEDEYEPSPEKPAPMTMDQPKDLNILSKILPYDKFIFLCNHKTANWPKIKEILNKLADGAITNTPDLVNCMVAIMELCKQWFYSKSEKLKALSNYISTLPESDRVIFFTKLIPFIASLALQVELMYPDGAVPLLSKSKQNIIKLSRREVSVIMANQFFSAIPAPKKEFDLGEHRFYGLFCDDMTFCQEVINQKINFIITYFDSISKKEPEGVITISRNCMNEEERKAYSIEKWMTSTKPLKQAIIKDKTLIETAHDCLQVDFANRYIGGGIDATCLQEQILYIIYPELFITTLLCEKMEDYEAIVITGVEQFSAYKGYSYDLKFAGPVMDPLANKFDALERIPRQVLGLDALDLPKPDDKFKQFGDALTLRELNKAYIGFLGDYICNPSDKRPVATGKWGCGVFHGCSEYKFIIQWLAASEAGRDMVFCSFDEPFQAYGALLKKLEGATVGEVTKLLLSIGKEVQAVLATNPKVKTGNLVQELLVKYLSTRAQTKNK